jgi:hypothetical protein
VKKGATWLIVGALVVLAAVAVADAVRGKPEVRATPTRQTTISVPLIPRNEPASSAMSGVLYYSDPEDDCSLHGLSLPDLGPAEAPQLRACLFSLSRDGRNGVSGEAEWSPQGGGVYARERGKLIELGSLETGEQLRIPGHAPAFKPDGTFTYVRGNEVVEWTTSCPQGTKLFTLPGDSATARCRRAVLGERDLQRALLSADPGPLIPKDLAWLNDTRLVTVVGDATVSGYREHVAVFDGRELQGASFSEFGEGLRIEASPRGGFFTAWYGHSLVAVRNQDAESIFFPQVSRVRALTWSPDERWTAVATQKSVFLFRTNDSDAPVRRLPIEAVGLAWR